MNNQLKPSLIEPGIRYFFNNTLQTCHQFKVKYNNTIWNILLFIALMLFIGIALAHKYQGKLTPEQLLEKEEEKRSYIMSKIKNYQQDKIRQQQHLITGLPQW
jgi:large-conductance mechanosensitive channel